MTPLAERALQRAIGQAELKGDAKAEEKPKGSNWGHPVQDYLASVGVHFQASWCMAFMYWCFQDAAGQLGMINPMKKTAGCLDQWHSSVKNQIQMDDPHGPQPGDIFIMDHGHGLGHTGIIVSIDTAGVLHTVEGNTNDTGSREGQEVAKKLRTQGHPIIGYLRF